MQSEHGCTRVPPNRVGFVVRKGPFCAAQTAGAFNQKHKRMPHPQTWSVFSAAQGIHSPLSFTVP